MNMPTWSMKGGIKSYKSLHHCQYNPNKLVCTQVKQEVTKENKRFNISDVERWVNKESDRVTQADWASWTHTTVKLQEEDYTKELCDEIFELIAISLQDNETKHDKSDNQDNSSSSNDGDDNMPLAAPLD
jgi:3-methyladenine DNA glycosylase AlkD